MEPALAEENVRTRQPSSQHRSGSQAAVNCRPFFLAASLLTQAFPLEGAAAQAPQPVLSACVLARTREQVFDDRARALHQAVTDPSDLIECRLFLAESSRPTQRIPFASQFDLIAIRATLDGQNVPLRDAGVTKVTLNAAGASMTLNLSNQEKNRLEYVLAPFDEVQASDRDVLTVEVIHRRAGAKEDSSYFAYARKSGIINVESCIRKHRIVSRRGRRESSCSEQLTVGLNSRTPSGMDRDTLEVTFRDEQGRALELGEVGVVDARVRFNGSDIDVVRVGERLNSRETTRLRVPLSSLTDLEQASLVELDINAAQAVDPRHLRTRRELRAYGRSGLWIPVGLVSTNFKRARGPDGGIPFAVAPVGLALGRKTYHGEDLNDYIGTSLIGSYQTLPGKNEQGEPDGSINWQGYSAGLLVDLRDWFYVGAVYVGNLAREEDEKDPGLALIVGVAPTLLQILKLLDGERASR